MSSVITNTAAMAALSTLRNINYDLGIAEGRMSSGQRVGQARDNAAYWSIGATMRSDDKAISAVQDALNLGSATTNVAYSGLSAAISVTDEIKSKLTAAAEPGVDKTKVNKEITQLKEQLVSIVSSSSFNGVNWLQVEDNSATSAEVAASYTRDPLGGVAMDTMQVDIWSGTLGGHVSALIDNRSTGTSGAAGILTSTQFAQEVGASQNYVLVSNSSNNGSSAEIVLTEDTTEDQVKEMLSVVDKMLGMMTDAGANFGSIQSRIDIQIDYTAKLRDWMAEAISRLVDTDMDQEATKIKALQAQQQLTTQALNIANSDTQGILQLFN